MRHATHPVPPATGIASATVVGDHTRLGLVDGTTVDLPMTPNRDSATTLRASVRRLTAVEIDPERGTAVAVGTGFRRPFMRTIPVSMALGLLALGVPGVTR